MTLVTFSKEDQPDQRDDSQYLDWLRNNPDGFVMAFTLPDKDYVTLHSARCSSISANRRSGAYTRGNYGKHCAETWQDVIGFRARPDARIEQCGRCSKWRDLSSRTGEAWLPAETTSENQVKRQPKRYAKDFHPRSMNRSNHEIIADFCCRHLPLEHASDILGDPYQCVPVCVVDAVFSIGVRYESTEAVVRRFCRYFDLPYSGPNPRPDKNSQLSVADFLTIYDRFGVDRMTTEIYRNRQRTSARSGILKSEAVFRFSKVLHDHDVNYLQDVDSIIGYSAFESAIRQIPGQRSGISTKYFYMLAGSDDVVKPDRMIYRFLFRVLGKGLSAEEMHDALLGAHTILVKDYPDLTPKTLDHLIWRYQRNA